MTTNGINFIASARKKCSIFPAWIWACKVTVLEMNFIYAPFMYLRLLLCWAHRSHIPNAKLIQCTRSPMQSTVDGYKILYIFYALLLPIASTPPQNVYANSFLCNKEFLHRFPKTWLNTHLTQKGGDLFMDRLCLRLKVPSSRSSRTL